MKKVLAFVAVVTAIFFSSCGNKSTEATTEPVAETEAVAEEVAPVVEELAPEAEAVEGEAVEESTGAPVEAVPAE